MDAPKVIHQRELHPEENPYDVGDRFVGAGGGATIWEIMIVFNDSVLAKTSDGQNERIFFYDQMEMVVH